MDEHEWLFVFQDGDQLKAVGNAGANTSTLTGLPASHIARFAMMPRGLLRLSEDLAILNLSKADGGFESWVFDGAFACVGKLVPRQTGLMGLRQVTALRHVATVLVKNIVTNPVKSIQEFMQSPLGILDKQSLSTLLTYVEPEPESMTIVSLSRQQLSVYYDYKYLNNGELTDTNVAWLLRYPLRKLVSRWFSEGRSPILGMDPEGKKLQLRFFPTDRKAGLLFATGYHSPLTSFVMIYTLAHSHAYRLIDPKNWKVYVLPGDDGAGTFSQLLYVVQLLLDCRVSVGPYWKMAAPEPALMLWPRRQTHLGHFIWNEMQSINEILPGRKQQRPLPVYALAAAEGVELYGPLERLFNCNECIFLRDAVSESEASRHAIHHGLQPLPSLNKAAPRGIRNRIRSAINSDPDALLLSQKYADLRRNPTSGERRLVIIYGLRLQNRTLIDLSGFYIRLTEHLIREFGNIAIIFDGLNRAPGKSSDASLAVYSISGSGPSAISTNKEMEFVKHFTENIDRLSVSIINCIGTTMLVNLQCLSTADFFVAPHGGGLVKYRWALNIPGLALTSKVNLNYCRAINIYDHSSTTEVPISPLFLTSVDEVEDEEIFVPGDSKSAREQSFHPYNENFSISETLVFPKILKMIRATAQLG